MKIVLAVLFIAAAAALAFIRFAPADVARWHIAIAARPAVLGAPTAQITARQGAAYLHLLGSEGALLRLDAIALAMPRTTRLAGSVAEGRITWVTRSRFFGFPDYTTAQQDGQSLTIFARQRFGGYDYGVNAARLRLWAAALSQN